MKLIETIELMKSEDFKDRFKAEYYQLVNRAEGLERMLEQYKNHTLPFTPKCSYELLSYQLKHMKSYITVLEERAVIEGIDLSLPSEV